MQDKSSLNMSTATPAAYEVNYVVIKKKQNETIVPDLKPIEAFSEQFKLGNIRKTNDLVPKMNDSILS